MRTTVRRRLPFSAAHTARVCGKRLHGHDWFAEVVVAGEPDRDTGSLDARAFDELELHVAGLDTESLDDVLPGVHPTPEGVAAWLLEQLRLASPGLVAVTVGFIDREATVEV